MSWFTNLQTRAKLLLGFGLVIVLMLIAMLTAYRGITALEESQRTLFERDFATTVDLLELRADLNRQRSLMLEMVLKTERSEQQALEQDIRRRAQEIDRRFQRLFESGGNDQQFLSRIGELQTVLTAFRQTRDEQINLIYEGKIDEARRLGLGIQEERFEKIRTTALQLGKEAEARAKEAINTSAQQVKETLRALLVVGLIALLVSVAVVLFLNRIIARPLQEISGIAERIADGDLNAAALSNGHRRDEVGVLSQTFSRMTRSLQEKAGVAEQIAAGNLKVEVKPQSEKDILGNSFTMMVENLRNVTGEIKEGVNVLATSASEIMASTSLVASGTAETATAMSQTTATVEEVKQTAQVSSQKAKNVSDNAQKVVQVSQNGKKAVDETIEGMNRIREQMEAIAESTVRLSEQGQAIGEIIASVNDLAERSNLLAVNAAIEAAKAGEQGRGFVVVAQEIRSLAEQSKQATAQVRTILNDIQQATNAAVMATEQGSKAVEAGVKQSAEAMEAIRMLGDSITESAQSATQIAASSHQQLIGMDQVALAMENIKQASTQNAASTKQAETAAQGLHELGQKLKQLVQQYQV